MRTGLYVFKPTTVSIQGASSGAAKPALMAYRQQGQLQPTGTLHLEPGIYQVLSETPVQITGDSIEVIATPSGKDQWPKPPPLAIALEPGATEATIAAFFGAAKDASPNG
ncbi:MAG TPA: hypothetical protein VGC42_24705 [Kofleriaceae bacterium]